MAAPREVVSDWVQAIDASLLGGLYVTTSVSPDRVRSWLRSAGRPFAEVGIARPADAELEQTARWVVSQSRARMGVFGALAAWGGAASVPPEVLGTVVAAMRLGQRLAVVYGFDPTADRGEQVVWRALAAGFEVDLPGAGPVGMRVSELPRVLLSGSGVRGGALVTALVRESAWQVGARVTRLIPVPFLSSGLSAVAARRRMDAIGARMIAALVRLAEPQRPDPAQVVDAVEVR